MQLWTHMKLVAGITVLNTLTTCIPVSCTFCIHKALSNVIHWVNISTCTAYVNTKRTQDIKYSICQQQRLFWWGQIECNLCRSSCTIRDICCCSIHHITPHPFILEQLLSSHSQKNICWQVWTLNISGALSAYVPAPEDVGCLYCRHLMVDLGKAHNNIQTCIPLGNLQ